jgi:hypothetical protein
MKKTTKTNVLKGFNDTKANAIKKANATMSTFKKSLPKAQKGVITGSKNSFFTKGVDGNDDIYNRTFVAKKDGKLVSRTTAVVGSSLPEKTTVLDTTGYSKGKKSFPAKQRTYDQSKINYQTINEPGKRGGTGTYNTFDVPRKDVKKVISQMKSGTGMNQKEKGKNKK